MWDPEFALEKEILTDPYRSIQIHTRFWDPASGPHELKLGSAVEDTLGFIPLVYWYIYKPNIFEYTIT